MILSIIIPVFNEEKTIGHILEKVALIKLPKKVKKEIIVVDDGSTDKTPKVLSEFKIDNLKFKIIRHEKNKGKGKAVKTGLKNATGDLIIIQDADLEYDPKDYVKLLDPILQNKTKVVFGSRLVDYPLKLWGSSKTVLPLHLIANRLLTFLVNFLYGSNLTDMETCYKLFSKEVLDRINLESSGFEMEPEITIKALKLGYDIFEVPIKVKPRTYGEGKKIGFIDGIWAIWAIFKYRF
ncbi:glycosyl transferase [Candidatus Daviesbacteria bacterium RIFCSPLOWO2_02_FULL_38_15]|uniref:Glycosyl transferase n=1 Tax=Candidatus Daviesbacteria bacterium RIFCSPLOWO2_02_FULL_38_15 TaxID=1797794 RepID=A0A1F5N3P2_9BACT|nr:MAG: glycosyl transferase [Candidatus Daviesbacteria bacterium RIFCSPLOWO2_02_FULL_38_15]